MLVDQVISACTEVFEILGRGYTEVVYQEALEIELGLRGISYEKQKIVPIIYKKKQVGTVRVDLIVEDLSNKMVVELKSISSKPGIVEENQLKRYMDLTGINTGVIVNFGQPSLNQRANVDSIIIDLGNKDKSIMLID